MRILIVIVLVMIFVKEDALAENMKEIQKHNEEMIFDIGYKPFEQALEECEKHFGKSIELPYKVPPIPFTFMVGRCNDSDGEVNDNFEVDVTNFQQPKNHYNIQMRQIKHGISMMNHRPEKVFTLDNGNKAEYFTKPLNGANMLVFERDGWQYILSIDKRVIETVPPETLVEIANAFR
ncbi:hypothetical protein ACSVDE_02630 [Pseudalkalibacillus sp. Hm43]|uniref:hypothetical protein n=1 Tax=Pseudalkalibacillus sp. Hm43 TaxID=3450742 RepID=UPI003F4232D3